ncbi:CBS domain-containing protein, partial [Halochromatium sp.]
MTSKKPKIPLIWRADPNKTVSEDLSEPNRAVVDEFARLIKAGARDTVIKAVRRMPPPNMVSLFVHLPLKHARKLTGWLDQPQLRIIAELNPSFRAALLDDVAVQRLVDVLDGFEPEEAADALDDLPDEVAEQVLPRLQERETIEALRGYGEESAGSIMSRKFVAVPVDWTVGQVTADIRANAEAIEKLYAVNVVDAEQHPIGYLRLRDLLLAPKETPVRQIMQTDFVAVGPETDQEEVARFADRYELSVVPVVDRDGRL